LASTSPRGFIRSAMLLGIVPAVVSAVFNAFG
jgi:hypothetical protein